MTGSLAYLSERFPRPEPSGLHPGFEYGGGGRFERIVQRHHARLRHVAAAMLVSDPGCVDDVLQEAYLRAYRRLPKRFANEAHEAAWLYRVVFRCCLDELRRPDRGFDELPAEVESSRSLAESYVIRSGIARALGRLSTNDRAVLLLVDVAGLDYERASAVIGVPRGTLAYRLSVARGRLRAALIDEGVRDV